MEDGWMDGDERRKKENKLTGRDKESRVIHYCRSN